MKTTEPKQDHIKKFSKSGMAFLLSALFTLSMSAKINIDTLKNSVSAEKHKLEKTLVNLEDLYTKDLEINEIEVVELEEDVELGLDISNYLPENFNALEGKNDLNWNTIELIEIEEEVELDFDTSKHLPEHFNALKGKNDLDWSTIELIEIEEDIEINFDTKAHLPKGFDPYKGITKKNTEIVVNF